MKTIKTIFLFFPVLLVGCSLCDLRTNDNLIQQTISTQMNKYFQTLEQTPHCLKKISSTAPPLSVNTPIASKGLTNVEFIGTPDTTFTLVSVKIKNRRLETILNTLIPNDWTVMMTANLQEECKQPISLNHRGQWPYILDALLRQNGGKAVINGSEKQVTVTCRSPFIAKSVSVPITLKPKFVRGLDKMSRQTAFSATYPQTSFNRASDSKIASIAPPVSVRKETAKKTSIPKIWQAERGATLKDTLTLWASGETCYGRRDTRWSVAWMTDLNYRIDAPLSFFGTFKDVINDVFRLYGEADVPLYAAINRSQCLLKVDTKQAQ